MITTRFDIIQEVLRHRSNSNSVVIIVHPDLIQFSRALFRYTNIEIIYSEGEFCSDGQIAESFLVAPRRVKSAALDFLNSITEDTIDAKIIELQLKGNL